VIYGGRVSLTGVAQALAIYLVLGLVFGVLAGYVRGVFEQIVVWVAEVSFAMPQIIVILAVLAIFANSSGAAMLALGLLGAPGLAVFVRGATRSVAEELYIGAARVSGLGPVRIMVRHIFPQITGPTIVQASIFSGTALLFQTGMDFLGLGTRPPTASWGSMVAEASVYMGRDIWMVMPAGLVIVVAIVALGLLGDALNDRRVSARQRETVALAPQESSADPDKPRAESARPSDALLVVRGLTVRTRSGVPVIRDVAFDVREGGCLGIVGESGSGKTMSALALIDLLPSQLSVTEGSIWFAGRELTSMSDSERRSVRGTGIGMISQEPIASLDPRFTVRSQISEVLSHHTDLTATAREARVIALLEQVRIPDPAAVARKYPHQLSGGMAQRVSIACALAAEPRLLIADEPVTALDVTVQAEILELLRQLRQETGMAMILVSHDWGVIADSCDEAVVLYAGEVVETADIHELFSAPRHPYSYSLMRSNPENAEPRMPLPAIGGVVPAIGEWPRGCHFAARCPWAIDECRVAQIDLRFAVPGHGSRCVRDDTVGSTMREDVTTR